MSQSTRPENTEERQKIRRSMVRFRSDPNANPAAKAAEQYIFAPHADPYMEASDLHTTKKNLAREASKNTDGAGVVVKTRVRRWTRTVTDDEGNIRTTDLASASGGFTPGDIIGMKPSAMLTTIRKLLAGVDVRPDLQGDLVARQALDAAIADFEEKLVLDEAATRAQTTQGDLVASLEPAFDAAYVALCNSFVQILGAEAAWSILPRFVRKNRNGPGVSTGTTSPPDGAQISSSTLPMVPPTPEPSGPTPATPTVSDPANK